MKCFLCSAEVYDTDNYVKLKEGDVAHLVCYARETD